MDWEHADRPLPAARTRCLESGHRPHSFSTATHLVMVHTTVRSPTRVLASSPLPSFPDPEGKFGDIAAPWRRARPQLYFVRMIIPHEQLRYVFASP